MKRLKGPELKVPPFLVDLFHDLRDRRLLPLIGLVLVAIVAVPFLLGGDSEEPVVSPAGMGVIEELKADAANASNLTVVEAKPGLRDYRRRLRGRQPTDPFKQRFTGPVLKGADLPEPKSKTSSGSGSKSSEGSTTVTETTTTEAETVTSDPGGAPPSDAGPPTSGDDGNRGGGGEGVSLYSFAIDVKIVRTTGEGAAKQKSEPTVKQRVLPTTPLPGKKAQVVTYMGISPKTKKPTFLVSTEVTAMFGEGKCAAGTDVCQLIELEPGFPETFVYGEAGSRYKLEVLDVEPVANGHY